MIAETPQVFARFEKNCLHIFALSQFCRLFASSVRHEFRAVSSLFEKEAIEAVCVFTSQKSACSFKAKGEVAFYTQRGRSSHRDAKRVGQPHRKCPSIFFRTKVSKIYRDVATIFWYHRVTAAKGERYGLGDCHCKRSRVHRGAHHG